MLPFTYVPPRSQEHEDEMRRMVATYNAQSKMEAWAARQQRPKRESIVPKIRLEKEPKTGE